MAMPTPRTMRKVISHWYSSLFHQGSSGEALKPGWNSSKEEISSRGWGEDGFLGEWEQAEETIRKITAVNKATALLVIEKII
jgi:hypothetical protein